MLLEIQIFNVEKKHGEVRNTKKKTKTKNDTKINSNL